MKDKKPIEIAEVICVRDWNDWCWDVCLNFEATEETDWIATSQAVQFPRDIKPEVGDVVEFIDDQMVLYNGTKVAIDVRVLRFDDDGCIYLD